MEGLKQRKDGPIRKVLATVAMISAAVARMHIDKWDDLIGALALDYCILALGLDHGRA
jgi:hypothetical protein